MASTERRSQSDVERRRAAAARRRGMSGRDPNRSFTDELIAERWAAAHTLRARRSGRGRNRR